MEKVSKAGVVYKIHCRIASSVSRPEEFHRISSAFADGTAGKTSIKFGTLRIRHTSLAPSIVVEFLWL